MVMEMELVVIPTGLQQGFNSTLTPLLPEKPTSHRLSQPRVLFLTVQE
jgi:hypothetical protein